MKKYTVFLLFFLTVFAVSAQNKHGIFNDVLSKTWETAPEFLTPESVCYYPDSSFYFVSNINGKPLEKDSNGFISLLGQDGKIKELKWVTGLDAPKGMGIHKGKLYVSDINRVAKIDIATSTIEIFYEFPKAQFLNDIAIDANGSIYISDMMSSKIYRITSGQKQVWMEDPALVNPNGLFIEGEQLLVGCDDKIVKIGIKVKKIDEWLNETGGIDGLKATGQGQYLFSDWQGSVYLVNADKTIEKILDTSTSGINAADIEYIPATRLLLVPTFNDNRVMAYELK